jgi:large repetitive protein
LNRLRRRSEGNSRLGALIAALIAVAGLTVAASSAFGWFNGGDHYHCSYTVRGCVYDAPDTHIVDGPSGYTNDKTPTFDFGSNQDRSTYECNIGHGVNRCHSSQTFGPLADGSYSLAVVARSNGHTADESPATRGFIVDTHAPTATILSGPAALSNDDTPNFTFKSSEMGTFQCRLDGAAFGPCTSPRSQHVGDGNHTFSVRAVDRAGNMSTPVGKAFTVDTTAPNTNITGGPAGATNDRTPGFTFNSSEPGSSFQCRVDGGSFGSCSSPRVTSTLGDGSHTFSVRAVDRAGNMDASPASRSFTVDATAPNTTITGGPTGTTSDATPAFTFKSSESGGSFRCKIDGGSFSPCSSPKTTSTLGNGSHTFSVSAVDAAGNTDASPAVRSFNVKRR